MTRDEMFQVVKDFCGDYEIQLGDIAPRVFYYGTVQDCAGCGDECMRVKSDALGGDMESWAQEISVGFTSEPDFEGFFVVLSIRVLTA